MTSALPGSLSDDPLVSIVIPIRNEEMFIARCLGAVLAQDYQADKIEVLVADGMSTDGTLEVIRSLPDSDRIRVYPNLALIQAAGLNVVIPQAKGDIIIRVDGHTIIEPDYVRQCVIALHNTGAWNVGGAMDPVGTTPMGRAIAAAGKSPFAVPTAFHVSATPQVTDTVYLGAWPRDVFKRVGLYNLNAGVNEDYELNYRIRQAGGKIYFTPAIRSHYYGRQTLRALARQYYRYGKSKVRVLRQHPGSLRPRHLVAPAFTTLVFGGWPLIFVGSIRLLWAAPILLYLLANLGFSVATAARNGLDLIWRLPVVFLIIHLSWGLGFWAELLMPDRPI